MKKRQKLNISSSIINGLFWKFGERICAQLITFLVSTVLARLLAPQVYGIVAIVNIFITIFNSLVTEGFSSALIQKKDADELDFDSLFYVSLAFSLILYLTLYFSAPYLAEFFNVSELKNVLRIFSLRLPISAFSSIQHAYVSKHMLFKRFFLSTLFGTVISGVVGITLALNGFGVYALVVQYLLNTTVDSLVLLFTIDWKPKLRFSYKRASALMGYGVNVLLTGLISTVYGQLRSFVIGKKYSTDDLAYYNYGERIPSLVGNNIDASISSVMFPALSNCKSDISLFRDTVKRSLRVGAYVIMPLHLGLMVIAEPLVRLLLTEKWLPCVFFLRIFCVEKMLLPISSINLQAIKALGKSDVLLKMEIAKKTVGIVMVLVSMVFNIEAIAYTIIIIAVYSNVVNMIPNKKLINYGISAQIKDLLPVLIINFIMAIMCFLLEKFFELSGINDVLNIVFVVLIGGLVYLVSSLLLCKDEFHFIHNKIFRKN